MIEERAKTDFIKKRMRSESGYAGNAVTTPTTIIVTTTVTTYFLEQFLFLQARLHVRQVCFVDHHYLRLEGELRAEQLKLLMKTEGGKDEMG